VKRLAGVDHGDAAARAIAERSQHRTIHVCDLNALNPCGPLQHERVVKTFQRVELLPLFDLGRDDRHQVKVALTGVKRTYWKRTEQVQPKKI
jgi:hypothetical protein